VTSHHIPFPEDLRVVDAISPTELADLLPWWCRRDLSIYFICKLCGRSQEACEKMLTAGVKDVISGEGRTAECEAAGMPLVRGRPDWFEG